MPVLAFPPNGHESLPGLSPSLGIDLKSLPMDLSREVPETWFPIRLNWQEIFTSLAHPYTKALIAAIPDPINPASLETWMTGEAPSALTPPPGCPFHPRCMEALPTCREGQIPGFSRIGQSGAAQTIYSRLTMSVLYLFGLSRSLLSTITLYMTINGSVFLVTLLSYPFPLILL